MYKYDKELEDILDKINLDEPAPEEEPARQYYFIKKARIYVKALSEKLGRPQFRHSHLYLKYLVLGSQLCKLITLMLP